MAEVRPARPGRIYLSYRRQDTAFPAAWLHERLVDRFGRDAVFKDIDSIDLGDDFAEAIRTLVGSCDVLLAMIGPEWATITDAAGRRRLDDPNDFVRLEIETALQWGVRIIPILVQGATLPRVEQLPISLAKLVRQQALELSPNRFDGDSSRLLLVLERAIASQQARRGPEERLREAERNKSQQSLPGLKVFLCHSSSDKPQTRTLYSKLQSDGMQPWLDEEDLLPGQDWDYEIRRAISASDVVLVCLSTGSVNKAGYLQKEIQSVLDKAGEQPPGTIFLIPVRLEPLDMPDPLRRWQWVDLFEGPGYERLIRALRHLQATRSV